jgi:hypothetical protein
VTLVADVELDGAERIRRVLEDGGELTAVEIGERAGLSSSRVRRLMPEVGVTSRGRPPRYRLPGAEPADLRDLDVEKANREAAELLASEIVETLQPARCGCIGGALVLGDDEQCARCGRAIG